MTIIDSQVHAYEANTPKRPWHSVPNWPDHVTGDEMVAAMDKVGVDGAIFISAFSMYRYDASYAVEVQRAYPGRFAGQLLHDGARAFGRTIDHHHATAAAPGERSELRGHRQCAASKDQQCRGWRRLADVATSF